MFGWVDPWMHYLRGRLFSLLRSETHAVREFSLALRLNPGFARAACALAAIHARHGRYRQAEECLEIACRGEPQNAAIFYNLGYVRERAGELARAIEAFAEAVRLDPKLDRAWYGMGLAYAALGRHREGARALEEAATLQPENPFTWYQLGMAYHTLAEPEKVREVIHHVLRFNPRMARRLIRDTGASDLAHLVRFLDD